MSPPSDPSEYALLSVALLFSAPALGGALFGYDIGATSFAIVQIKDADLSGVSWWDAVANSPALQGLIVAAVSAGALLGSAALFLFPDRIGRRTELRIGATLYVVGAALELWASSSNTWSAGAGLTALLAGRLIYGTGVGVTMHGAPTYLSEQSPSSIRGLLVSLKEACIVLGILLGYVVGLVFSTVSGGWGMTYGVTMVPASLVFALSFVVPESCRWLLSQGRESEALTSLKFVFLGDFAEAEFGVLKNSQEDDAEGRPENPNDKGIWDPSRRAPLVAGIGVIVLQQITGQPSVLSYATPIFQDFGLTNSASVILAVFKLVATLCTVVTVDKYGRKNLLFAGCALMLAALLVLAAVPSTSQSQGAKGAILAAMVVYIGGYQVGFGPIGWVLISEVFPLSVRGQAVALAVQMNFLFNMVVQFVFPILQNWIGLNITFAIFAVLTSYSIYFVKTKVPETKGLSLEEIEQQFANMYQQNTDDAVTHDQPHLVDREIT